MDDALAYLKAQDKLNYSEALKLYGVSRTALSRRHQGISVSRSESTLKIHQALNNV